MNTDEQAEWLGLPLPGLLGDVQMRNAACALLALHQLRDRLPLQLPAVQCWLKKNPTGGKNFVLFSILSDKDIDGVLAALKDVVDEWHYFPLEDGRAMPLSDIQSAMDRQSIVVAESYAGLGQAWANLRSKLNSDDRVVAFGSFLVVSSVLENLP